jgi:hypothetical protein
MLVKYFKDTDTALFEFSNITVLETKEITENIYIDIDREGNQGRPDQGHEFARCAEIALRPDRGVSGEGK